MSLAVKKPVSKARRTERNKAPSRAGRPCLSSRDQFEELITTISTQFINLPAQEIDKGIAQALKKIGRAAKADRSAVFLFKNGHVYDSYEWCAPGIHSIKDNLQGAPRQTYPWLMEKFQGGENVHIPRVDDLPPEAKAERGLLQSLRTKSLVMVPMILKNRPIGFLGFDSMRREMKWSERTLSLLKIVGEMFVNALERKRAVEVFQESEKKYRRLVDNSLTGIYVTQNHVIRFCNRTFAEIFGFERPEELIGQSVRTLVHPDDWKIVDEQVRLRESGRKKAARYEFRGVRKNGTVFEAEVLGARIQNGGEPAIQGSILDITQRKKATDALRESEKKYRALFEGVPVGLFRTDPRGRILDVNSAMARLLGVKDAASAVGIEPLGFFVNPEDYEKALAIIAEEKALRNFVYQLKRADGRVIWAQTNVNALTGHGGRILYLEGSLLDITRQRQEESALQRTADEVIRHQSALLELAKLELSDVDSAIRMIVEIVAATLSVDRVSVWLFDAGHAKIRCHDLYESGGGRHDRGMTLLAKDYPH
jgi:PAS domain S-box-containing protein